MATMATPSGGPSSLPSLPPAPNAAANKFKAFESWLRTNGARFPLLELRKYDPPPGDDNGMDDVRRPTDDTAAQEEKKDGGGGSGVHSESEGVAHMSLGGNRKGTAAAADDGSGEMRGVHARTDIPPQLVCVSIPKACLITVEMGQATPLGRKILASDLELDAPKHIFLMVYLLWDRKARGASSFFAPYYDVLPRSLRNMPVFWNEEELALLEGSHLLVQVSDRAAAVRDDYEAILSVAPELADVATPDEFLWARMIVCSRNFGLLINGRRTSALVPHADMLNHRRPRETKWTFCEETQCFTITTLRGIKGGEQVYDSYGQKCNHRFLLNYGFCVEKNAEIDGFCPNEVPLELGLDLFERACEGETREQWERKLRFWTRGEALGEPSAPTAVGLGAGFQALAAAVAGSTSTDGAAAAIAALSSSTDIVNAVATLSGSSAMAAMTEAAETPGLVCPIKRIRVCVSNNENTRVLFSLLRVLACSPEELDRIALGGGGRRGGASSLPFYSGGTGSAAQRLLFGAPVAAGSPSPLLSSSPRTCRDVRYPISLRNERRAMGLLLELATGALARYPTSLAQDAADLRDERAYPPYGNARNARLQVRGEKEVLHHFATWARTGVEVIDVITRELEERRESLGAGASPAPSLAAFSGGGCGKLLANSSTNGGTAERATAHRKEALGYDVVVQAMADDDDCHLTILRYVSDVLGAARSDAINRIASNAKVS